MSIFDTIKNAIFRHADSGAKAAAAPTAPKPAPTPPASTASSSPATPPPTATLPPGPADLVDVEPILDTLAKKNGQKLNWRTSIVDLMKLLDLDSGLEHRKQLATELGYRGSTTDSAAMNIWLHKEVMAKLAANGGRVPASLQ